MNEQLEFEWADDYNTAKKIWECILRLYDRIIIDELEGKPSHPVSPTKCNFCGVYYDEKFIVKTIVVGHGETAVKCVDCESRSPQMNHYP